MMDDRIIFFGRGRATHPRAAWIEFHAANLGDIRSLREQISGELFIGKCAIEDFYGFDLHAVFGRSANQEWLADLLD